MTANRTQFGLRIADIVLAYTFLRIVVGVNYFNHGFTRLGDIPGFMDAMVDSMQGAWMPEFLVRITAAFVSPVELIVGLLITIGLFTRAALVVCFGLMVILMYGVTVVQNWDSASSQLIYNIVLFILLAGLAYNRLSVDHWLWGKRAASVSSSERPMEGVMKFTRGGWRKRHRRSYEPSSREFNV